MIGTYPTAGAMSIGAAVNHIIQGGKLEDIPETMRDTVIQHLQESQPESKTEEDITQVGSGLAGMSNPVSLAGQTADFGLSQLGRLTESDEERSSRNISEELEGEDPYAIAESGLSKRLRKGGAQAEYARKNSLMRMARSQNLDTSNVKPINFKKSIEDLAPWKKEEELRSKLTPKEKQVSEDKDIVESMGMGSSVRPKVKDEYVEPSVKPKVLTKKQIEFLDDAANGNYVFGTGWKSSDNYNMYGAKRRDIKDILSKSEFDSLSIRNPIEKNGYIIELVPVDQYGSKKSVPPEGYEFERTSFIRVRKKL